MAGFLLSLVDEIELPSVFKKQESGVAGVQELQEFRSCRRRSGGALIDSLLQ
jgi:hypothetical protein